MGLDDRQPWTLNAKCQATQLLSRLDMAQTLIEAEVFSGHYEPD